ncbi:MAG: DUF951 family protein, partial [Mollicutes bacterium PWAP]|nr:DUF951 family protein [Mollicutes bacterium PWAP]
MFQNNDYKVGDLVFLKKTHPSGTKEWEIVRMGADIKIKSTIDNGLFIMMPRFK